MMSRSLSICRGLSLPLGRSNSATNRSRKPRISAHAIGSNAPGSRLHTIETTCQGRVAKALGLRATELRCLLWVGGSEGVGDGGGGNGGPGVRVRELARDLVE